MFQVLCMQLLAVIVICGAFNSKLRPKTGPNILKMADKEKVVVTGLGIVSPTGTTAPVFFDNLCAGKSGLGKITRFDADPFKCQIGGEITDFNPRDYYKSKKKIKQNDLYCHFAVAASHMAMEDAGIDLRAEGNSVDATRVGAIIGSAFGGFGSFEESHNNLKDFGPSSVNPYTIPMILGNTAAGIVGMELGCKGPNFGIQTACASATHAFGETLRLMRNGDCDVMIAGGSEAALTPLSFAGFCNLMAMNFNFNDDPTKASRPFDADRGGFVMSEGAGVLVLETMSHAVKRGAKVYCELAGYGASCDAYHITSPDPEGDGLRRAMLASLEDGGLSPAEVDYINAHGTSTKKNDLFETIAYKATFGEEKARKLAISSIKGSTGHSLGAAGAFEAVACVKTIEKGIIAPTINYETPDPECDLDYTPNQAREMEVKVALSDNLGFGGHNGVVAFRKIE